MCYTAISATQASPVSIYNKPQGTKENYSKFETFKIAVNTITSNNEMCAK